MPLRRSIRPSIALIGAGNVARVLAVCLHHAGYKITELVTRDEADSKHRGAEIARKVKVPARTYDTAQLNADVLWLCVTDDAIAPSARLLAARGPRSYKYAFHSSGALTSWELAPLKQLGAAAASVHPMNTFVATSKPDLTDTPFALEGDKEAVRLAESIARKLSDGGEVFRIKPENKVLYHAIGSFSSPLLVSLLEAGEQVARAAGITDANAVRGAILRRTLDNYLQNGASIAFSGPIRRGDAATVRKHLQALAKHPDLQEIYQALAKNALKRLPVRDRALLD